MSGRSVVEAVSLAENLGLVVQVEPVGGSLPEGMVLAQSPEAGIELRKGQVVILQVSRGGKLHPVPDLSGKNLIAAQNLIKESGFTVGDVIKIREGNLSGGTVIAYSPSAPANIISGRKIDLLVQEGGNSEILIPDASRLDESEARKLLGTNGIQVTGVERVYSPLVPEGLVIESKPAAGSAIKLGQGVILKLATQKRPAGYIGDEDINNKNNSSANNNNANNTKQNNNNNNSSVRRVNIQTPAQNNNAQEKKPEPTPEKIPAKTQTQTQVKTQTQQNAQNNNDNNNNNIPPAQDAKAPAATGNKTVNIRYQVPPLTSPMSLKIELTDPKGTRTILNRQARSGESINIPANYSQECMISIYLGGTPVWQEKHK